VGDIFSYVALAQKETGLPMVVWVPDAAAKDPCLRFQLDHSAEAHPNDATLVTIEEDPVAIDGATPSDPDWRAIQRFVKLNHQALREHLRGNIDTLELGRRIVKIR